jgi:hypothetical protein
MAVALIGGFLVGLPAIAVVLFFWGSTLMFPALASLFVASLPVLAFAYVLRRGGGAEGGGAGH